ncbi:MAG: SUKH-3 domain-containing protein [Chitinophagales bacterium]|nr:SUKH-3 domain-containing protein [Chitinophagales bacterium]
MEFNKDVTELLKKAGWKEGRKVSLKELELPLDNYPNFIIEFLQEYGNLKIDCEKQDYSDVANELYLDASIPKEKLEGDHYIPYYQSIIKRTFFPIGLYLPDSYDICCDVDGRVYKIGEYCFYVGKNLYEGIENILLMNTLQSLQLDEDTGKWWNMKGEYVPLP